MFNCLSQLIHSRFGQMIIMMMNPPKRSKMKSDDDINFVFPRQKHTSNINLQCRNSFSPLSNCDNDMNELREINTRVTAKQSPKQRPHLIKEKYEKARNESMQRKKQLEQRRALTHRFKLQQAEAKKTAEIIRDSMQKHIEGYRTNEANVKQKKIIVKSFSGATISALALIHSYLSNRRQRVKINGSFSTWKEISLGLP